MSRDLTVQRDVPGSRRQRPLSRVVWRSGLLALCVIGVLAFTLHSLRLSDASFTASSPNPSNVFVAGSIGHDNSQGGKVMINVTGLDPGEYMTRTMTLTGTGSLAGDYTLMPESLVDSSATPLSDKLTLTVEDVTGTPTVLFDDVVSDFDAADPVELGSIAPGAMRSFDVTIEYPDGPNVGPLQGSTMTLVMRVTETSQ